MFYCIHYDEITDKEKSYKFWVPTIPERVLLLAGDCSYFLHDWIFIDMIFKASLTIPITTKEFKDEDEYNM